LLTGRFSCAAAGSIATTESRIAHDAAPPSNHFNLPAPVGRRIAMHCINTSFGDRRTE
jgi:hypothetical protein